MNLNAVIVCTECGHGLPVWQQLLLSLLGGAIAIGLLLGVAKLLERWLRQRPRS